MVNTLVLIEFQTPRLVLVLSTEKLTQLPQGISFFARTELIFLKIAAGCPPVGPVVQHIINKLALREKCPNTEFFLVRILLYPD